MKILYQNHLSNIEAEMLLGFFVDWPNPPSSASHFKLLNQSTYLVLALHESKVIGFITAISDQVLSAYIPLLEVLPEYQGKGIGKQLVIEMEKQLKHLYMIDVVCDASVIPFYQKLAYTRLNAMVKRNYKALDKL